MPANQVSHLRKLRLSAGLTVRELAQRIGAPHTNIVFWENNGKLPRSEVLVDMAKALGVSVEEVLGRKAPGKCPHGPAGKARKLFEQVSELPRRQQSRILGTVEDMLIAREAKAS